MAAGRDLRAVTLVAVTKTYPATDVATLRDLGMLDVGESRDQEARAKAAELGSSLNGGTLRWHFIGRIQTNKAASISRYAHAVHSMDRLDVVTAFAKATADREQPLEAFVQVSLDGDPSRGGAVAGEALRVAAAIAESPGLRLRGVMAVPPLGSDTDRAFAELAELSQVLRSEHAGADAISAGMSSDLEVAVRHGATHVRVGTALLGRREAFFS
jgi:pyridoxal phosphate enzyme (YggS family)